MITCYSFSKPSTQNANKKITEELMVLKLKLLNEKKNEAISFFFE